MLKSVNYFFKLAHPICLCLFATTSFAQQLTEDQFHEIQICSRVGSDDARLRCYDNVLGELVTSEAHSDAGDNEPPEVLSRLGPNWTRRIDSSPMDDSQSVFLSTRSLEPITDRFANRYRPTLTLRCRENTSALIFNFDGIFVADSASWGLIDMRFDQDPPREVRFRESTDNRALGLWRGAQAIPMMRRLVNHDRLIIRFTGFNDPPRIVEFNISDARPGVEEIANTCNWSL